MDYSTMNKMRFLSMKIRTLERNIKEDKKELFRVQTDLLSALDPQQRYFLKRKEVSLITRIANNTEKIKEAKAESLQIRQVMAESLQIRQVIQEVLE